MAIIDEATIEDGKKIQELKAIDINDTSLPEGATENINPDADAWERACPPPDGTYKVAIFEAKVPYQQGKTDDGQIYYVANLETKIIENEEWKNIRIFAKVSTYIGAGKEISTMAGLIRKFGVKVAPTVTHLGVVKLLKKCLAQEPKLFVEGEWKVWDMKKEEWLKQGMKNFPKSEDGKHHIHIIRDSGGNQVAAKFKPVRWWGIKEYQGMMEKQKIKQAQAKNNSQAASQAQTQKEEVGTFQPVNAGDKSNNAVSVTEEDFVIDE